MKARVGSMALVVLLAGGLALQAAPPQHRHTSSRESSHAHSHSHTQSASNPWQGLQQLLFGSRSGARQTSHRVPSAGHKMRSPRRRASGYRSTHHQRQQGRADAARHSHSPPRSHRTHTHRHNHGTASHYRTRDYGEPTPVAPSAEPRRRYGRLYSSEQAPAEVSSRTSARRGARGHGSTRTRRLDVPERIVEDQGRETPQPIRPATLEDPQEAEPLNPAEVTADSQAEQAGSRSVSSSSRRRRLHSSELREEPQPVEEPQPASDQPEPISPAVDPARQEFPAPVPQAAPASSPAVPVEPTPVPQGSSPLAEDAGPAPLLMAVSPTLAVQTLGPRELVVGQVASYRIRVKNAGQVNAQGIVVSMDIPTWVEVVQSQAAEGKAQVQHTGGKRTLEWHLDQLAPGKQTELALKLRPTENRPVAFNVRWITQPLDSRLQIAVKEARLELALTGPDQVEFGQRAVYRLTFSNPGTADAKNVKIRLLPIDPTDQADEHTLGTIPAGGRKVVEVELVARRRGTLNIQVEASAEGGVSAASSKQVRVLQAQLAVAVRGPKFRYAGTPASYQIEVANRGDAAAKNVVVEARLPSAVDFLNSSHGGRYDEKRGVLRWKLGRLAPGEAITLKANLEWTAEGQSTVRVEAKGEPQLQAAARLDTRVVGLADLDLDLKGPHGAAPVGEEITYQVILSNQGTKAAESVFVRVQLSPQLQPLGVEGVGEKFQIQGTQISASVDLVPAGKKRVLKIRCRALEPGNHVVQVQALCPSLNIQLGEQKTTRFYGDEPPTARTTGLPQPAGRQSPAGQLEPAPLEPIPESKPSAAPSLPGQPGAQGAVTPGVPAPATSPATGALPSLQRRYGEPTPVVPLPARSSAGSSGSSSARPVLSGTPRPAAEPTPVLPSPQEDGKAN